MANAALKLFYSVFPGYSRAALINFLVPDVALIRGRRSDTVLHMSQIVC